MVDVFVTEWPWLLSVGVQCGRSAAGQAISPWLHHIITADGLIHSEAALGCCIFSGQLH